MIRRLLHLGYFCKSTDYPRVRRCILYVRDKYGVGLAAQFTSMLHAAWVYGASFEDFYDFKLFDEDIEVRQWATTVDAHYFHRRMNAQNKRCLFRNKYEFLCKFRRFAGREFLDLNSCSREELDSWIKGRPEFVAKPIDGEVGRGVELIRSDTFSSPEALIRYLKRQGLSLIEEKIEQHDDLNRLNPDSVNTVRVVTVLRGGNVQILGSVLRMSCGSFVDNFAAGGIAAPVDFRTGNVIGPAVSKMPNEQKYERHPITGARISGFCMPYWQEVLGMIRETAQVVPDIRTVGWDIGISNKGPVLIEGNDNWDKTLWQLPFNRGMRDVLLSG